MTNATKNSISRTSISIAAISTIVEWYDFTLYLYFATVLSRVFFGGGELSIMIMLAGFAVSYFMRPLGAIFFGYIGDRYGRRSMMRFSMALMSIIMLATALLPTYQQIGVSSGFLILLLRCGMAFSVGGEYTGVVAYLLEGSNKKRRGLNTSIASAASEIGALLAVGISALTVSFISTESLDDWGWRIPFFIGAILAASLWMARSVLQESPDFISYKMKRAPRGMGYVLTHHRRAIARTFAISALGSITYYIGITYVPVFLTSTSAYSEKIALWFSTIAAVSVIIITPIFGAFSDYIGRKPVLILLAIVSIIMPPVLFMYMANTDYIITMSAAVLMACLAGGVSAVGPSSTAEQFPIEGRLLGLALGATAATTIFGGLMPYLAQMILTQSEQTMIPGIMIAVVALCVLPVFIFMPETAPSKIKAN